ncbi:unnamed protein product [marine sediment metagenome]|uniref:Uncharacterized protein n=1 Tax=marine sediment metagenome TaxID=412755 RepID=X1MVV7_9ZZZZ
MMPTVEVRLAKVEQKLHDLKCYIMNDMKADMEKLEERYEERVEAMEKRSSAQFRWMMSIYLITFTAIITLILGLCVR